LIKQHSVTLATLQRTTRRMSAARKFCQSDSQNDSCYNCMDAQLDSAVGHFISQCVGMCVIGVCLCAVVCYFV